MSENERQADPLDHGIVRMVADQQQGRSRWPRQFMLDRVREAQASQRAAVFGLLGACLDALDVLEELEGRPATLPTRLRLQDAIEGALGAGFRARRRGQRYSMPVRVGQILPEVMQSAGGAWKYAQEPRRCFACGQELTPENCEDPERSDVCFCRAGL